MGGPAPIPAQAGQLPGLLPLANAKSGDSSQEYPHMAVGFPVSPSTRRWPDRAPERAEPLNIVEQALGGEIGDSSERLRVRSWATRSPVVDLIVERMPQTLWVVGLSYIVGILIAIPIGIISAYRQYSWFDQVGTFVSMVGFSVPTFFTGLLAIIIFSVMLQWLPSIYDTTHRVTDQLVTIPILLRQRRSVGCFTYPLQRLLLECGAGRRDCGGDSCQAPGVARRRPCSDRPPLPLRHNPRSIGVCGGMEDREGEPARHDPR